MRMANLTINNRLITNSINNNYKFLFFGLILIIYFMWMDIALFVNLQRWSPPPIENTSAQKITTSNDLINLNSSNQISRSSENQAKSSKIYNHQDPFSVFKPLSVKLIMVDHVTHYVHDILARFLADTLHFTRYFPWITANLVSFTGLFLALIGCRLTLSDKLFYRQIGALLFEARNLADSLDGVVFRSRKRDEILLQKNLANQNAPTTNPQLGVYQSQYGTFGYNVDVICDGLAGTFFVIAICVRFIRHPPIKLSYFSYKSETSNNNNNNTSNDNSYSNYAYQKLNNENIDNNNNYSFIQMNELNGDVNKSKLEIENPAALAAFTYPEPSENNSSRLNRHFSSREVKILVFYFGIRLLFTGLIWDHYVHKYHDLLMVFSNNPTQRKLQGQAFKSIGMWLIMWFWRIGNACSILEHLVIMTFFDKLWEYLLFTSYIGWGFLVILTLFTQIHYIQVRI